METVEIDPADVRDLHVSYLEARRRAVDTPLDPRVNINLGIMITLIVLNPDLDCPLDGPCRWCDPDDLWRR